MDDALTPQVYTPPPRPIVQKAPMGWPEAITRVAGYAMWAVIFAGWPKIIKQAKANIAKAKADVEKADEGTDEIK